MESAPTQEASSLPVQPFVQPEILQSAGWQSFRWLVHGFSTRAGGHSMVYRRDEHKPFDLNLGFTQADDHAIVLRNREAFRRKVVESNTPDLAETARLITLRQVHSSVTHTITSASNSDGPAEGDGMMTLDPNLLLAIQTADCVPVLVADPDHRAVAAFHAGWRGTVQRVVELGIHRMRAEFGSNPASLQAVIGPCIGGCCYSVGEEVRDAFGANFAYAESLFNMELNKVVPGELPGGLSGIRLDLVEANRRQLLDAGLDPRDVHAMQACTYCQSDRFFSHRKEGGHAGRMMSVIGIAAE